MLLDEAVYQSLPESKKALYLHQWLQGLPQVISDTPKAELKDKQKLLVGQLQAQLNAALGPPLRTVLAQAFVTLYSMGDTFSLHDTIGKCCDIIRAREDVGVSSTNKLTCIECLGALFEHHGRMAGSLFLETMQLFLKALKVQEYRAEILNAMGCVVVGLGTSSSSVQKEIYKSIRTGLGDKSMLVRSAAAKCGIQLAKCSTFLYSQELDAISNSCLKALEGSNYEVRCSVAAFLGTLVSLTQKPLPPSLKGKLKLPSLEEALLILSNGFIRGASMFMKAGGADLLKTGTASREVRVGITQGYTTFLAEMGGAWAEKHLPSLISHVLDLAYHTRTTSTHIDAVYSRKCVSFILRFLCGKLLSESAQLIAAKHLCSLVCQRVAAVQGAEPPVDPQGQSPSTSSSTSSSSSAAPEKATTILQHLLICSVLEVSALVCTLNTAALPLVADENAMDGTGGVASKKAPPLLEALGVVLLHHSRGARLAGAWCLRCVGVALPSQLSRLLDFCLGLMRGSPGAVYGSAYGMAALMGTVRQSELGMPSAKAKELYQVALDLIHLSEDSENHTASRVQSGWSLLSAYISMGPTYVRAQVPALLALWKNFFPHSMKQLKEEQSKESLNSLTFLLEQRTGVLSAIVSFLRFCGDLVTPEIAKRLLLPLESALAMLSGFPALVKVHGVQLKASGTLLKLRLYQAFSLMSPAIFEGCLNTLLKELVMEFTLADNLANTTTSLLRSMCHPDDSILLGSWLEETDQQEVEEQLQPNSAAGSGALEHDPSCLYFHPFEGTRPPGPLPLGVAVIDAAIVLFGKAFPAVTVKHRQQLLGHFEDCIRQAKSARQQAIQINIFTAFLVALKNLVEVKSVLGQSELLSKAYGLIASALTNPEPILRCAAGEALGRMSQVGGDASFVASMVQTSFDTLKSTQDPIARTGHALVLGCLHRYVGGMGSGHHLQSSVSVLQTVAKDTASPLVQVWALHALALIADCGGPMFRNYVEPTLTLVFNLLVTIPTFTSVDVHKCLGKCLNALITTLGPELQDSSPSMRATRSMCLACCAIIQEHPNPVVRSAAIGCFQQLQLFASSYMSLPATVPPLCDLLDSPHLLLRRAAANCLRQFIQRDPKVVWSTANRKGGRTGLEYTVLAKLDSETDPKLCEDLREILFSLLTSLAPDDPMRWLLLCNGVLSASAERIAGGGGGKGAGAVASAEGGHEEEGDDDTKFTSEEDVTPAATRIAPRWPTKVFAVECSRKIYGVCRSERAHFDLSLAQKRCKEKGGDFLVMHLSELVKTSFIAATANVVQLRLAGYEVLRDVIQLFQATPDPDYVGHVLLEQYQAQVVAALRPAFTADTPPHVTAMACQVCSEWLGSGVSRNIGDLQRVQQLLVSSLEKLKRERREAAVYGEAVATMESLAVLKAWAELYIKVSEASGKDNCLKPPAATKGDFQFEEPEDPSSNGMELLDPHLPSLSQYWLGALRDHAYLTLPIQYGSQLPPGAFYIAEVSESVKPYYASNWASLLLATATWLESTGFEEENGPPARVGMQQPLLPGSVPVVPLPPHDPRQERFRLVLCLAVQALCTPATLDCPQTTAHCLQGLRRLLGARYARAELTGDPQLAIEAIGVLHRLMITCQSPDMQLITMEIALLVGESLAEAAKQPHAHADAAAGKKPFCKEECLDPGKSCAYGLLQVAASFLLRVVEGLRPKGSNAAAYPAIGGGASQGILQAMSQIAIKLLVLVVGCCAPPTCTLVLPLVLHMLLAVLSCSSRSGDETLALSCLQCLQGLCGQLPLSDAGAGGRMVGLLRSCLASVVEEPSVSYPMSREMKLSVMAVLLLVPAPVCPPTSELFGSCVKMFESCILAGDSKLQLKVLLTCESLFKSCKQNDLANHFIHRLGPLVVGVVEATAKNEAAFDTAVVTRACLVLEGLLDLVDEGQRTALMGFVVPLFIRLLMDPASASHASKQRKVIHDHVLQSLKQTGPKYPAAFKAVMQNVPQAKQQLEAAIRAEQAPSKSGQVGRLGTERSDSKAPAIKLKMDFSNFK